MTLEERAEAIAMNAVRQDRSSEGLYFVDQKQFALHHLREAVAEALAKDAAADIVPFKTLAELASLSTDLREISREEFVKKWRETLTRMKFSPPLGEFFAVDDSQGNIRVFEVDGEVQPTAIVEARP